MEFVIITGMSGAGKSSAVKAMEDIGYYCVDNMPPVLLSPFAEVCSQSMGKIEKVAMVIDLRGGDLFNQLFDSLEELKQKGIEYKILFLDSTDQTLIKRYKQTRRSHPLAPQDAITEGIKKERKLLCEVRQRAEYIIDTTALGAAQLKEEIRSIFTNEMAFKGIVVNVISFGFKYGIPMDADLVYDVRFLPNPYYIENLRPKTGMNKEVRDYVRGFVQTREFETKLFDMMDFLIPHYIEEGKNQLIVAIGCTGGKHRSVTIAESLANHLKEKNYSTVISHRDCRRE